MEPRPVASSRGPARAGLRGTLPLTADLTLSLGRSSFVLALPGVLPQPCGPAAANVTQTLARGPGAGPRGPWRGLPSSAGRAAPAHDGPSPEACRRAGGSASPEEAGGAGRGREADQV